ncbi:MAG: DUF932 domain-containing protein [archaeon]|nr:DUF932 domain-containing protein [archaeon]
MAEEEVSLFVPEREVVVSNPLEIPLVCEYPVFMDTGDGFLSNFKEAVGWKAITEPITKRPLAIVSQRYSVVQHRAIATEVVDYCEQCGYQIVRMMLLQRGAKLMIEVNSGDMVEIDGDEIEKHCLVYNSYNLTKALSVLTAGMRLVCSNGLVAPGFVERLRKVHIFKTFEIAKINQTIEAGFRAWDVSRKVLEQAVNTMVSTDKVLEFVKLPETYLKLAKERLAPRENLNEIWNCLTQILTHETSCGVNTTIDYYKEANKVFQFLPRGT